MPKKPKYENFNDAFQDTGEALAEKAKHLESKAEENKLAVNIVSRTVGAAFLAGGYIFRFIGLVPSCILIICTISIFLPLHSYLIDAIYYTGSKSYKEVVLSITNRKFALLMDLIIIFLSFGTLTSYQIIINNTIVGQLLKHAKGSITLPVGVLKLIIKPCVAAFVIFPLTLLKNTKQLARISPFSVASITIAIMSVFGYFMASFGHGQSICMYEQDDGTELVLHNDYRLFSDAPVPLQIIYFFKYIPTLQFTLSSPAAIPIVYQDLKGPVQIKRYMFKASLLVAILFSISMYSLISFSISLGFGQYATDNAMDTFSKCNYVWMDIVSAIYSFVLILAYPLVLQPPRVSIMGLLGRTVERNYCTHVFIGLCFVLLTCTLACVFEKIVAILGLFSAVCGFFMYFFVPIMCAYKMPYLKERSSIPTLREQLNYDGEYDNLMVAIINMMNFRKLTEKARQVFKKRQRRSMSIATTAIGHDRMDSIQTAVKTNYRAMSLIPQRTDLISDASQCHVNLFQIQKEERNEEKNDTKLKKFDYTKEYTNANMPLRRAVCITLISISGVLCVIALVLNLIDFFK